MLKWLLVAVLLAPSLALAQNQGQVVPNGKFTPGHTFRAQNSTGTVAVDGGGAAGSSISGQGYLTEIGITNTGAPFCINDALINASTGYHQFCLGANALGGGLISYNAIGNASPLGLNIVLNGVTYPFPGSGGAGNVVAPTSPTPTAGDIVCWNGGTTVKDSNCQANDGPITAAGTPVATFGNSTSVLASTICTGQTGCNTRDVVQSVINMPASSTFTGGNAFAAYGLGSTAGGGGNFANPVLYYGVAVNNANNSQIWGINIGIGDGLVSGTPSGHTGQALIGAELDLQIDNSTTIGNGFSVQMGNSSAQSVGVDAFSLAPGSKSVAGVPTHFLHGFICGDGATVVSGACVYIGKQQTSGANVLSQIVQYAFTDGSSNGQGILTGVSAAQHFYFQNTQGVGTMQVDVDGSLSLLQTGGLLFGAETGLSAALHTLDLAPSNTITSLAIGNGTGMASIAIGNSTTTMTLNVANGGAATKYVCVDASNKIVIQVSAC